MAEKDQGATEFARQRVRRLVLDPLQGDGFRFKRAIDAEAGRRILDRLADDVAYMSDDGLRALRQSLRTKGEGAARHFWPAPATVIGLAEAFQSRPLGELPALLRWFASAAGRQALIGNRLVAEYWFWQNKKRPPVSDVDRRSVAAKAADLADQVMRAEDREKRGCATADDVGFLDYYRARVAYLRGLVGDQEAGARNG